MSIASFFFGILIMFIMSSCQISETQKNNNENIKKIINEWNGKEIVIPPKITYTVMGKDTLCHDIWEKPFKILTYIDSVGCTSCQLNINQWKQLIDASRNQYPYLGFLFVVHSPNYEQFEYELILDKFDYPLIYDAYNRFDKLNHFPPAPYRTFLLDKDNKVLLVGSPVNNPQMWDLYKKTITSSE